MQKVFTSYRYEFGTDPGQYPPGTSITDFLLKLGTVTGVMPSRSANCIDFVKPEGIATLDLSGISPAGYLAGDYVTVFFESAITINY